MITLTCFNSWVILQKSAAMHINIFICINSVLF